MLFVADLDKSHFEPASASTVRRRCDDYTATMRRRYGDGTVKIRAAHGGGCLFPSDGTKEQPIKPKCVFKNFSACRRLISSGVFHRITNTPDRMNDFWTKFGPRKKSQKKIRCTGLRTQQCTNQLWVLHCRKNSSSYANIATR